MSVRLISLTIVGFILGAFAAGGVGVRVIREVRALDDATSLPAQNIARSDGYHVDPAETLVSSTALIPTGVTIDDRGLVISYSLSSLAPTLGLEPSETGQPLYPKEWLIEALGGEFEGLVASPSDTTVVFPLLAGGSVDQVDAVKILEAYIPAPFEKRTAVSSDLASVSVMAGVDVELVGETDDGDTTTIEIRIITDPDVIRDVYIVGDGPGWHPATTEGDSVILTREKAGNGDGAAPYLLVVGGTSWTPVDGEFVVDIGTTSE